MDQDLEQVLKRTIERQSRRIAGLMVDLDLAYSQIELLKEIPEEPPDIEKTEKVDNQFE